VQCIGEAFGIDPANTTQIERLSIKPATLQSIFEVYLKTTAGAVGSQSKRSMPSSEMKANADKCKQAGNQHMSKKAYGEAIESYSQAIELDGTNPVVRIIVYSSPELLEAHIHLTSSIQIEPLHIRVKESNVVLL